MYAEGLISKFEYELGFGNGQAETLAWRENRIVDAIRARSDELAARDAEIKQLRDLLNRVIPFINPSYQTDWRKVNELNRDIRATLEKKQA